MSSIRPEIKSIVRRCVYKELVSFFLFLILILSALFLLLLPVSFPTIKNHIKSPKLWRILVLCFGFQISNEFLIFIRFFFFLRKLKSVSLYHSRVMYSNTSSGDYEYHRNGPDQEQHHIDYNPDYSSHDDIALELKMKSNESDPNINIDNITISPNNLNTNPSNSSNSNATSTTPKHNINTHEKLIMNNDISSDTQTFDNNDDSNNKSIIIRIDKINHNNNNNNHHNNIDQNHLNIHNNNSHSEPLSLTENTSHNTSCTTSTSSSSSSSMTDSTTSCSNTTSSSPTTYTSIELSTSLNGKQHLNIDTHTQTQTNSDINLQFLSPIQLPQSDQLQSPTINPSHLSRSMLPSPSSNIIARNNEQSQTILSAPNIIINNNNSNGNIEIPPISHISDTDTADRMIIGGDDDTIHIHSDNTMDDIMDMKQQQQQQQDIFEFNNNNNALKIHMIEQQMRAISTSGRTSTSTKIKINELAQQVMILRNTMSDMQREWINQENIYKRQIRTLSDVNNAKLQHINNMENKLQDLQITNHILRKQSEEIIEIAKVNELKNRTSIHTNIEQNINNNMNNNQQIQIQRKYTYTNTNTHTHTHT
eukprot:228018_1